MKTGPKAVGMSDLRVRLSTLWLFAVLNYLYCDVVGLMDPALLRQFITGQVGSIKFTQGFLLTASVLVEIPIAMVLATRVLKYSINRWVNIIAGAVMTTVQALSLFAGTPTVYYAFFSVLEISCTMLIVWYALRWRGVEG